MAQKRRRFLQQGAMAIAGTFAAPPVLFGVEPRDLVVETGNGKVRGVTHEGVRLFRGIPYGGDTSGRNRFKPPVKPIAWAGVRDCTDWGHIAPQRVSTGEVSDYTRMVGWNNYRGGLSEDCGCLFLTCTMETAGFVDILSYHDYSQTRAQIVADIVRGQKFPATVHKPLINTEMACVGRANPYDIEIEEHNKAHMGWFIWELMVARYWGNVHGIFYSNGTIRDPSIVAAVMGFYRNRGPDIVMEETDREGLTSGLLDDARKWLADAHPDYFGGMVLAETEANTLEAGQLTGMRDLPTRKVDMLRSGPQNFPALRLLIEKFTAELAPNAIAGQTPRHRFYTPDVPH